MKTILTSIFLSLSLGLYAQSNFYKLSIGGGAGFTQSFTDVQKHGFGKAVYGVADFMFTPFSSLGLEAQAGRIHGGNLQTDPYHREFTNSYKSVTINGKLYLGGIVDHKHSNFLNQIKGLYAGAGVGVIKNVILNPKRNNPDNPSQKYPGQNNSYEATIPLNLGINYYLPDRNGHYRYVLNLNYQSNITLGEGLDGYDNSTLTFKNGSPDVYHYYSIGLRYNFGPMGLSSKTFKKY